MEMFDGTSLLAAWFCSASNAAHAAFYWSIFVPALYTLIHYAYAKGAYAKNVDYSR
jgi:hypothetical protein